MLQDAITRRVKTITVCKNDDGVWAAVFDDRGECLDIPDFDAFNRAMCLYGLAAFMLQCFGTWHRINNGDGWYVNLKRDSPAELNVALRDLSASLWRASSDLGVPIIIDA